MFDPALVSYDALCELFWDRLGESRYALNQVGNDRGTQPAHAVSYSLSLSLSLSRRESESRFSTLLWLKTNFQKKLTPVETSARKSQPSWRRYRHGIYTHTSEQLATARQTFEDAQMRDTGRPIRTEIMPASKFWDGEDYHQQYLEKGGQSAKKNDEVTIRCYG